VKDWIQGNTNGKLIYTALRENLQITTGGSKIIKSFVERRVKVVH